MPFKRPFEGILLTSGRSCLRAIVDQLRPARMWVPFLICDSVPSTLREAGVEVMFYGMDDQARPLIDDLAGDEAPILAVDHYGVRGDAVQALIDRFGQRVVIDLTHALYAPVPAGHWAFSSIRKWFGIPDGGVLHAPYPIAIGNERNDRCLMDHLVLRGKGYDDEALALHRVNNAAMRSDPVRASLVSEALLSHTDREQGRQARAANFKALHQRLSRHNRLEFDPRAVRGPLCYPLLPERPVEHARLHASGIFVPCYWPEVLHRPDVEGRSGQSRGLARWVLPLPVDQRYTPADMEEMLALLEPLL